MSSGYALVAPLVGAWIEIFRHPVHEVRHPVAPLVGAWIEMDIFPDNCDTPVVAPLVGAWIEIIVQIKSKGLRYGRSPCGSVD